MELALCDFEAATSFFFGGGGGIYSPLLYI